ncbi:unnamed protein product [Adineta ricciae]|uniref:G-protein coupled receptors family 1 profile domain-containing protein n=1 Tax=Adineta ricciae TaxID=249248 RepID=A0A816EER7_ADIRI|nr:unnamed protein product [Adineta ricciae]CAF1648129.1 unnamed protein product [Adineta ricciae]
MVTSNIGFILNFITIVVNVFSCFISFLIVLGTVHHLIKNRLNKDDKITIILAANIYSLIFFYTIILISFNIQAILGELYAQDFNSWWCIFLGYLAAVFLSTIYWSFANQAFFRLCRIVYSTIQWFQYYWLYIIIPPIEFIVLCLLFCPLLLWHDIVYISTEYYCNVRNRNIRGVIWLLSVGYGGPLLFLFAIYIRIAQYLYQRRNTQTLIVRRRQQRELIVVRRIFITVTFLIVLQIPRTILFIMLFITGDEYTYFARVEWLFLGLSMIGLSLSMAFSTPQLKKIIVQAWHFNRIMPANAPTAAIRTAHL